MAMRQVVGILKVVVFYVLPWPLALGFAFEYYKASWRAANPPAWLIPSKAYELVQQKYPWRLTGRSTIEARDQMAVYWVEASAFLGLLGLEKKWPESKSPSSMERSTLTSFTSNKGYDAYLTLLRIKYPGWVPEPGLGRYTWDDELPEEQDEVGKPKPMP